MSHQDIDEQLDDEGSPLTTITDESEKDNETHQSKEHDNNDDNADRHENDENNENTLVNTETMGNILKSLKYLREDVLEVRKDIRRLQPKGSLVDPGTPTLPFCGPENQTTSLTSGDTGAVSAKPGRPDVNPRGNIQDGYRKPQQDNTALQSNRGDPSQNPTHTGYATELTGEYSNPSLSPTMNLPADWTTIHNVLAQTLNLDNLPPFSTPAYGPVQFRGTWTLGFARPLDGRPGRWEYRSRGEDSAESLAWINLGGQEGAMPHTRYPTGHEVYLLRRRLQRNGAPDVTEDIDLVWVPDALHYVLDMFENVRNLGGAPAPNNQDPAVSRVAKQGSQNNVNDTNVSGKSTETNRTSGQVIESTGVPMPDLKRETKSRTDELLGSTEKIKKAGKGSSRKNQGSAIPPNNETQEQLSGERRFPENAGKPVGSSSDAAVASQVPGEEVLISPRGLNAARTLMFMSQGGHHGTTETSIETGDTENPDATKENDLVEDNILPAAFPGKDQSNRSRSNAEDQGVGRRKPSYTLQPRNIDRRTVGVESRPENNVDAMVDSTTFENGHRKSLRGRAPSVGVSVPSQLSNINPYPPARQSKPPHLTNPPSSGATKIVRGKTSAKKKPTDGTGKNRSHVPPIVAGEKAARDAELRQEKRKGSGVSRDGEDQEQGNSAARRTSSFRPINQNGSTKQSGVFGPRGLNSWPASWEKCSRKELDVVEETIEPSESGPSIGKKRKRKLDQVEDKEDDVEKGDGDEPEKKERGRKEKKDGGKKRRKSS